MARLFNLARMNTATTGTGAITLGSAVSGFLSFAAAGVTNGQEVFYGIKDGSASEVGRGTYSSSGTQLTRTVIKSTNSDTAINLSGSAEVFITYTAEAFYEWGKAVDANGFNVGFDNATGITDDSLNETLIFAKTASAVNYVEVANSATTNGPTIAAKGDDTNIDLNLNPKGTGVLKSGSVAVQLAGKHTIWVPAVAMMPRVTNGPSRGVTELATNDIMLPTLDFDTTTEEGAGFWIRMPKSYNGSTITFTHTWTAASGSGGIVFSLAARAYADDDAMDTAVGTAVNNADTFITGNDMHVSAESGSITIAGTPAGNSPVYFEIKRVVGSASDTLGVDAKLIGIHIFYTTNAATDA